MDNTAARNVGTIASLLMPAEALRQRAAWLMQPTLMRELHATPFSPASVPSPAMVGWAVGYGVLALVIAVRGFARRQLWLPDADRAGHTRQSGSRAIPPWRGQRTVRATPGSPQAAPSSGRIVSTGSVPVARAQAWVADHVRT